ncbi:DUF6255 family natural product biosynthesis protein [Streptomyces olivoverticillatus]|uniref:DUF6255 family natural product biosynthesis protein n=1 Tax=Streptomyces olivoverticillatus TaxID=66427 RepID=UPI003CCCD3E8
MTAYAAGRLVAHCTHHAGWAHGPGQARCRACGTIRFTAYGALRPTGLPVAIPSGPFTASPPARRPPPGAPYGLRPPRSSPPPGRAAPLQPPAR